MWISVDRESLEIVETGLNFIIDNMEASGEGTNEAHQEALALLGVVAGMTAAPPGQPDAREALTLEEFIAQCSADAKAAGLVPEDVAKIIQQGRAREAVVEAVGNIVGQCLIKNGNACDEHQRIGYGNCELAEMCMAWDALVRRKLDAKSEWMAADGAEKKGNNRGRKGQPRCSRCVHYISATIVNTARYGKCAHKESEGKHAVRHHSCTPCGQFIARLVGQARTALDAEGVER